MFVYGLLRGLARNLANKNRIENPRGFSDVGGNKQLLIANFVLFGVFYFQFLMVICFDQVFDRLSPSKTEIITSPTL